MNRAFEERVHTAVHAAMQDAVPSRDRMDMEDALGSLADRVRFLAGVLHGHAEQEAEDEKHPLPTPPEWRKARTDFLFNLADLLYLAVDDARRGMN